MSRRSTLIVCSILANIALGVVLCGIYQSHSTNLAKSSSKSSVSTPEPESIPENKVWLRINSDTDDKGFVARLRELGFPERVVRSLVHFRIEQKYADQVRALTSVRSLEPFWRTSGYSDSVFNPEARAKLRAMEHEANAQARAILGPDADKPLPGDYGYNAQRRFGNLSTEKIAALKAISRDYSELSNQIEESSHGVRFPDDREKLAYLEKEEQADRSQLLTPEELDQYERRSSSAAYEAREELQYLDGNSEKEFLTLYQLRHDFDQQYGRRYLTPTQEDQRQAAKSKLDEQIKTALGPERYAEYQIVNDGNFRTTRDFVIESGLSSDTAKTLVTLQRNSLQKAEVIRSDKSLTNAQQTESLQTHDRETRKSLATLLGDEKFSSYQKYHAGKWLSKIVPAVEKPAQ